MAIKNKKSLQNLIDFGKRTFTNTIFGTVLLILIAIFYLLPALKAPFFGDNDYWSNLLPIIHFRHSIIYDHVLPKFTELWYGGRAQWQNPLWSFLYLPSSIFSLTLPLNWAVRIIITTHLIFSLIAGKKLSSLFIDNAIGQICTSIILTAPILPAILAGHLEKILAWGWVLLAFYFILNKKIQLFTRGIASGLCWGTIALIGSNYYVFYTGLILIPLLISLRNRRILFGLIAGASIGLLHLPSVWYLIGTPRTFSSFSIPLFSVNLLGIFTSLASGFAEPYGWESWSLIGLPIVYLFLRTIFIRIKKLVIEKKSSVNPQLIAVSFSMIILILFATGVAYRGQDLFDTFRIPVRAITFVALAVLLYLLFDFRERANFTSEIKNLRVLNYFLFASVLQISIMSFVHLRPPGSVHSPYDSEASNVADILLADNAKSVWVTNIFMETSSEVASTFQESTLEFTDTYVDVVLTDNGLSLPNVYYGDMGQIVPVTGPYCGYSFDHLVSPTLGEDVDLVSKLDYKAMGIIPKYKLQIVNSSMLDGNMVYIYRVVCN